MSGRSKSAARILIVDDHPIVQQGYSQLIGNQDDLDVCGVAGSGQEALEQMAQTNVDLAIVDISLKDSSGIELVKQIKQRHSRTRILVISAHDENLFAERALEAGALGYINKQEAIDKLIEALRRVLAGEVYVSEHITRRLLKNRVDNRQPSAQVTTLEKLTDRELQVFQMIGHGQSTKKIAGQLHLSPKTIERYKENIKRKLELQNSTELVQRATRWVFESG